MRFHIRFFPYVANVTSFPIALQSQVLKEIFQRFLSKFLELQCTIDAQAEEIKNLTKQLEELQPTPGRLISDLSDIFACN